MTPAFAGEIEAAVALNARAWLGPAADEATRARLEDWISS